MRIIISERQSKLLDEIRVGEGKLDVEPIYDFYGNMGPLKEFTNKHLVKLTKKFLEDFTGMDLRFFPDKTIIDYLVSLSVGNQRLSQYPKPMRSKDIAPSLAYYLSKSSFKLKDGLGLKYFVSKVDGVTTYWFFDPEIKQLIGYMKLERFEDFSKGFMKVSFVAIDKAFQGRGYGTKMYLNVINNVKVLYSDKILYKDSLNIWVNILPKYVKVWAKIDDGDREFVKVDRKTFIDPENVDYFFTQG